MDKLPPHFRNKWSTFSVTIDPTQQSIARIAGKPSGLTDNPDLGQTFNFANGALVSYGNVTEPFLVYGDIYQHWYRLGGLNSGYGHPIADPQFLPDGTICTILEGGHLHKQLGEKEVEAFSPNECLAPHKPPLPAPLSRNFPNWPIVFRQKWTWLSIQRGQDGKQHADLIGAPASKITENDNGGKTLAFSTGALVSYDDLAPPFLVYGKIYDLWCELNKVKSGLGHPLADPQILGDGSICNIFEGGHIHQIGTSDAEIFPASRCTTQHQPTVAAAVAAASKYWPYHFRQKWTSFSTRLGPNGKQLGVLLGPTSCWPNTWPGLTDNEDKKGGKTLHFQNGQLVSNTPESIPVLVYGKIYELWHELNMIRSGLGYPLADPQTLPDGTVCSIFEGGHIHQVGTRDAEIIPAMECASGSQLGVAFSDALYWPALFRSKWASLAWKGDPNGKQVGGILGPTSCWPNAWPGLTDNEDKNGGKTLHFNFGQLVSKAHNAPPLLVYGKIYNLWYELNKIRSGFGYPLADPQTLPDGTVCSIFEGAHIHQIGARDAEIVPASECASGSQLGTTFGDALYWPAVFRSKWASIASKRDPNGKQIGALLGPTSCWPNAWPGLTDNEDKNGGKTLHFNFGQLVSNTRDAPPVLVYGKIYDLWHELNMLRSGFGYPLADPQILPDGTVCSIFEGAHIHQIGTKDAEIVPASECTSGIQLGTTFSDALHWPAAFRSKWATLAWKRDPNSKQMGALLGPTSCWPNAWPGLEDNEDKNGGKTLHFNFGQLVSKAHNAPPVLVYGKIYDLWHELNMIRSGFGYPLADPQTLPDGTVCSIFEGAHIHQIGAKDAEIVPANECTSGNQLGTTFSDALYWPALFRSKWASLAWKRDPSGKQLGVLLGPTSCWPNAWPGLTDNEDGGKTLHFQSGRLVSYAQQTPPVLVHGKICEFWIELGGVKSHLGYPLADPQFLPDESICTVFEGGHIHRGRGSDDADVFPANQCTAPYKPTSRTSAPIPAPSQTVPFATQEPRPPVQDLNPVTPVYSSPTQPPVQSQQPPQYTLPGGQYALPEAKHTLPGAQYGSPEAQHIAPGTQYGLPVAQHTAPGTQYGMPEVQHAVPSTQYGLPVAQHTVPGTQYTQYASPTGSMPPGQNFPIPSPVYSPPTQGQPPPAHADAYPYPSASQGHQASQSSQPVHPDTQTPSPGVSSPTQDTPVPGPAQPSSNQPTTPHHDTPQAATAAAHGKHKARLLVGKGIRKIGAGMNRVADAIEKHANER